MPPRKSSTPTVLLTLFLVTFAFAAGWWLNSPEVRPVLERVWTENAQTLSSLKVRAESQNDVSPLTRLSLRLNAKFWRGLDKNDFSLHYEPQGSSTIVIRVKYRPGADLALVRSVSEAAKEVVEKVGQSEFSISPHVEIDIQSL